MQRVSFNRRTAIGVAAGAIANSFVASPPGSTITQQARAAETVKPRAALFKVGTQNDSSDVALEVLAAFGVNNICSNLPSAKFDDAWSVDGLKKLRERVESYGLKARHGAAAAQFRDHRQIGKSKHSARQEPGARSRNRQYLPDD